MLDKEEQKKLLKEKTRLLRQKAWEARQRVQLYAGRGRTERIIVILTLGGLAAFTLYYIYARAINTEYTVNWACQKTETQDCEKYDKVLKLWRPYRDKPYNIPSDDE